MPRIPYLRLRVRLRALAPAVLPGYHGSMLRGAFGHALRRTACVMGPAQPCPSCRLRRACAHARLFEALIDPADGDPPPFLRGLPTAPRPYLFEPGSRSRHLAPGEELSFDLLLFGRAIELQGFAVLAIERMAEAGLGQGRARFALSSVRCPAATAGEWRDLFTERAGLSGWEPPVAWVPPPPAAGPEVGRACIRFLTPVRLKPNHQLARSITFRGLTFAILRRALELAHFHVPGAAVDWTIRPLLERAGAVRTVAADLRWCDWERYSARQETRMSLGGLVGDLEVEGDMAPFAPLLRAAEVLHVGKGTTFGLGKLEYRPKGSMPLPPG